MATEVDIIEGENAKENLKSSCSELCKNNKTVLAVLEDIVAVVKGKKKSTGEKGGFRVADINGASGALFTRLRQVGIIDVVYSSARKKEYALREGINVEWLEEVVREIKIKRSPARWRFIEVPDDLFSIIQGYDDIKYVLRKSLQAEKAASVMLVGPPASGKSLFLMELERLGGTLILAGTGTKAGIRDVILEERPALMLLDEIEKCDNPIDLAVLLTWMETGRIIVVKHKDHTDTLTTTKPLVFAAANTIKRLPPELLSRFSIFHLPEYTPDEFKAIVINVLTTREETPKALAQYIAQTMLEYGYKDVREAIRVARLTNTRDEARKMISILTKYKAPQNGA